MNKADWVMLIETNRERITEILLKMLSSLSQYNYDVYIMLFKNVYARMVLRYDLRKGKEKIVNLWHAFEERRFGHFSFLWWTKLYEWERQLILFFTPMNFTLSLYTICNNRFFGIRVGNMFSFRIVLQSNDRKDSSYMWFSNERQNK